MGVSRTQLWLEAETDMSKQNKQNFVSMPFNVLTEMLRYKLQDVGMSLEVIGEAYTSKCSALDCEDIGKHDAYELQETVDAMVEAKTWAKFILKQDIAAKKYHFSCIDYRTVARRLCEVASYLYKDKECIDMAAKCAFKLCKQNEVNITIRPHTSTAEPIAVMPAQRVSMEALLHFNCMGGA